MPLGVLLSSLLFGFVNSVANYIATINVPSELIQMIPYLVTLIALGVFAIRARKIKNKTGEVFEHFDEEAVKLVVKDISGGEGKL